MQPNIQENEWVTQFNGREIDLFIIIAPRVRWNFNPTHDRLLKSETKLHISRLIKITYDRHKERERERSVSRAAPTRVLAYPPIYTLSTYAARACHTRNGIATRDSISQRTRRVVVRLVATVSGVPGGRVTRTSGAGESKDRISRWRHNSVSEPLVSSRRASYGFKNIWRRLYMHARTHARIPHACRTARLDARWPQSASFNGMTLSLSRSLSLLSRPLPLSFRALVSLLLSTRGTRSVLDGELGERTWESWLHDQAWLYDF